MQRVSALTLRKRLGEYIDVVAKNKEPVVVSRANEPLVAMIPAENLEEYQRAVERRAEREEAGRQMDELRERLRKRLGNVDVVSIIRQMRDSR